MFAGTTTKADKYFSCYLFLSLWGKWVIFKKQISKQPFTEVLKYFAKLTEKKCRSILLVNKPAGHSSFKMRLQHRCLLVNFVKHLKISFLTSKNLTLIKGLDNFQNQKFLFCTNFNRNFWQTTCINNTFSFFWIFSDYLNLFPIFSVQVNSTVFYVTANLFKFYYLRWYYSKDQKFSKFWNVEYYLF